MYCIHCGGEGVAAFCATCGRRQSVDNDAKVTRPMTFADLGIASEESPEPEPPTASTSNGWFESIQYETVLASAEPRARIAEAGNRASKRVTGDDLLAVFDAVSPIGFSLEKFSHAILPIYDKLGIKTEQESQAIFDAPPGRVMLAVLCTLAVKSLEISEVGQEAKQCSLSAQIPSGLITNRGKLHILISVHELYVQVTLATTISGQWYDFGKSKRLSDEVFKAIHDDVTSQQSGRPPRYRRVA